MVPDTLMEVRDMALLKKCLNDGGTSLPFLHDSRKWTNGASDYKYNMQITHSKAQ